MGLERGHDRDHLSVSLSLSLGGRNYGLAENVHPLGSFSFGDGERGDETQGVKGPTGQDNEVALLALVDDFVRQRAKRASAVVKKLDANHEARPAHFSNHSRVGSVELGQDLAHLFLSGLDVAQQGAIFECVKDSQGSGASHSVGRVRPTLTAAQLSWQISQIASRQLIKGTRWLVPWPRL